MRELPDVSMFEVPVQTVRVIDRLLEPVVIINPDSSLRYANAVAASFFELSSEALIGRKLLTFIHPDDHDRVARELARSLNTSAKPDTRSFGSAETRHSPGTS